MSIPQVVSVNVGKPQTITYTNKELTTGLDKQPVDGPVYLGETNLEGDGQADLVHHGGKDKAVCVYIHEHYAHWNGQLQRELPLGAFGENLTVTGLDEAEVQIGDVYRIGGAVVQVSQPRQPCYKLAEKYGLSQLPLWVQQTGFTGFYFRVLEQGFIAKGDAIELIRRAEGSVTLRFANDMLYHDKANVEGARKVLQAPGLSDSWRETFGKRLKELEV